MRYRTTPFIIAVAIAAAVLLSWLSANAAPLEAGQLNALIILCSFALVADLLVFLLPQGAAGSISSIPTLACVLVAPSWHTVVAMTLERAIAESARRAENEKAAFNIAQQALTVGVTIVAYLAFGGESFLTLRDQSVVQITRVHGLSAFGAFATYFAVNSMLVSTVIALAKNSSILSVWKANNMATIGIDMIASPIVFLFAWVYVRYGAIVAAGTWVPMIGIRQLHKANIELEQSNEELLELMVKSIEARDPYTSGHSRRVQNYSIVIARSLGLPEKEVQFIGRVALLHDVGKIHEKYGRILRKAEMLSAEEWDTMREHPADGASLIATMTRLRDLVAPVKHHHENWDGTGYPDGLAGERIPLAARVVRFADTIDAMTTERPYRRMLTADEVRKEIIRCRATQFDPKMVDSLLSSAAWKTMFAPVTPPERRFGLSVVPRSSERVIGA